METPLISDFSKSPAVLQEAKRREKIKQEWETATTAALHLIETRGAYRVISPREFFERVSKEAKVDEGTVLLVKDDLVSKGLIKYKFGEGFCSPSFD